MEFYRLIKILISFLNVSHKLFAINIITIFIEFLENFTIFE